MSIASSYRLLDANEQLSNKHIALKLFPKIMDGAHQVPNEAISGWSQYVRPNGKSFWVYVDGCGAVCIETERARQAASIVDADEDFDVTTSEEELDQFLEQIAPSILTADFKRRVMRSSYRIQVLFTKNGTLRWIFNVWGPSRWSFCNVEYAYM